MPNCRHKWTHLRIEQHEYWQTARITQWCDKCGALKTGYHGEKKRKILYPKNYSVIV